MPRGLPRRRRLGAAVALGSTPLIVVSVLLSLGAAAATATDADPGLAVIVGATPLLLAEPGGDVVIDVTVRNGTDESVTLSALTGKLDGVPSGDLDGSGTCATGGAIPAGGEYACSFALALEGNAGDRHTYAVRATVRDEDGGTRSRSDRVTVTLADVAPTVEVSKTVDRSQVAPGDTVTFTIGVRNTSVEPVTLTELADSIHGVLDDQGTCQTGGTIEPGATYDCAFSAVISRTETDTVTATVRDDEGGSATAAAEATVAAFGLALDKRNDAPIVPLVLPDGSTAALPTAPEGTTVTYTIEYTLTGDPLSNAVITDIVPFGLQYVKGSAGGDPTFRLAGFDPATGTLSWRAATVRASGSITYSAFVVEGASGLSQPLENIAALDSDQTDPMDDLSDVYVPAAVAGVTSPPKATLPPTDTLGAGGSDMRDATGVGLALVLAGLTVLVSAICLATSTPPDRRRPRGR